MNRILSLVTLAILASPLAAQAEPEMKSGDVKKLAKPFGAWVDAKIENDPSSASEAMMDMEDHIKKMEKKLKGRKALSMVADWENIFATGRSFDTSGKLVKKGRVLERELGAYKYLVWLPSAYAPAKNAYPTLLLLDEDAAATIEEMPKLVKDSFIILAPQIGDLEAEKLMEPEGRTLIIGPLGQGTVSYRVDRSRLFLVGKGEKGISFASAYAAILPHFFSGAAMVGGEATDVRGKKNLDLLPVEQKADMQATADWVLGLESANKYPTEFEIELVEPWNGVAYWVQAVQFDTGDALPEGKAARLKVAVDRGTNTITIDGEYVYKVQLNLNDILVDLDKPITILRNGETYSFQASRSLGTMLDTFASSLDGAVFPAKLRQLDMPVPAEEPTDG